MTKCVEGTSTPTVDKFSKAIQRSAESIGEMYGRRLVWTSSARARLACIAGFIEGVKLHDPESAEKMAASLDSHLTYLSQYGGNADVLGDDYEDRSREMGVPAYKVMLHDDCWGLGGFGLAWYRCLPWQDVIAKTVSAMPAGSDSLPEEERDEIWKTTLEQVKQKCKLWETKDWTLEMYETRHRKPLYEDQPMYCRSERFDYAYSFNGGLILHWNGDPATASWSTHT